MQQMIQEFDETFIVLNALDECNKRQELLITLEEIARWRTGKLHILATSRIEQDIAVSLEALVQDQGISHIQNALVNNDIRIYVRERLQTYRGLERWQNRPEVQFEIETTLMSKADGM